MVRSRVAPSKHFLDARNHATFLTNPSQGGHRRASRRPNACNFVAWRGGGRQSATHAHRFRDLECRDDPEDARRPLLIAMSNIRLPVSRSVTFGAAGRPDRRCMRLGAYGKPHNSIRAVLLPRGGIPPVARRRSQLALTLAEREDISRGIAAGSSIREIASRLDACSFKHGGY